LSASVQNPKKAFIFIIYISSLVLTFHAAREGAKLCRSLIESTIGRPKLLRETSRTYLIIEIVQSVIHFLSCCILRGCDGGDQAGLSCEDIFEDVILPPILKERVISIAKGAKNARQFRTPYRHVLFYGPPGTGKTMVARKLAKSIGMDYALMSGGDVGPLGPDAVTQIHNLFTWSKLSRKGVLLFIDEAEAFLADRKKSNMSDTAHNALNALLYNTGSERRDFMLVLATNRYVIKL
jgi:ATPase family AAA domain-containing protein 3A/B